MIPALSSGEELPKMEPAYSKKGKSLNVEFSFQDKSPRGQKGSQISQTSVYFRNGNAINSRQQRNMSKHHSKSMVSLPTTVTRGRSRTRCNTALSCNNTTGKVCVKVPWHY